MRILEFSLHNYKSYPSVGPLRFEPGFNVIVGPNNAGKTALLPSIQLQVPLLESPPPGRKFETSC